VKQLLPIIKPCASLHYAPWACDDFKVKVHVSMPQDITLRQVRCGGHSCIRQQIHS
jgi:hypothetical protein